jgi:hypothetical protein
MTVKSYQITAVGSSHTRKEYESGEPVGVRTRAQKDEERRSNKIIIMRRYGFGDVIKLEEDVARSHSVAHLRLRQTTGTGTKKKSDEPIRVPLDWEQLAPNGKRSLAAKISGKPVKSINLTDADKIIRDHLATLPVNESAEGSGSETEDADSDA